MEINFEVNYTKANGRAIGIKKSTVRKENVQLYKCPVCKFKFFREVEINQDITNDDEKYYDILDENRRNSEYQYIIRRLKSVIRVSELRKYSILDIGCGTGAFLEKFGENWIKVGIEPSKYGSEQADKKGIQIFNRDFFSADLNQNTFDAVSMIDVIEHLEAPVENIEKAFDILKPGGVIAIKTGDIGNPLVRLVGSRWTYFNPCEHISFFSSSTLSLLLTKTGFEKIKIARLSHGRDFVRSFNGFIDQGTKGLIKLFIIRLRNLLKAAHPDIELFDIFPSFNMNFQIPVPMDHILVLAEKPKI